MVDVANKPATDRLAVAEGRLRMQAETLALILEDGAPKGDVLAVARVAGIQAAKRTAELVPLCHPLPLTRVAIEIEAEHEPPALRVTATTATHAQTGVEMEALTAACVTLLTLYDMAKGIERGMVIEQVALCEKSGGRGGPWHRPPEAARTQPAASER
jgi:cyclic pyranopterin phosphate synthase